MKTEKEINEDILNIIRKIEETSPELSKYIDEMPFPVSDSTNPEIKIKNLQNYYDSLYALYTSYQ